MKFKEIQIDENLIQVYVNDIPINLDKKEYNLLLFFLTNRNKVFSRKEIIEEVWTTPISEKAIDTCISRLRKKLGEASKYIVTRKGFGFGFIEQ